MSDMGDFDKAVVAAMLKAKEIGVKMLASDCEEILQAAKQSMQGDAVGEVYDHDSYDHNGQEFMRVDWKNNMLPVGTKLYTHAPDSAARIAELEAEIARLQKELEEARIKSARYDYLMSKCIKRDVDDLITLEFTTDRDFDLHDNHAEWVASDIDTFICQIGADASLNIKGGAE